MLHDLDYRAVPFLATQAPGAQRSTSAPGQGRLQLDAQADGRRFQPALARGGGGLVPLPGDSENWPQDVTVDSKRCPCCCTTTRRRSGWPRAAGDSRRIPWRRSQQLRVPATIGRNLRVDAGRWSCRSVAATSHAGLRRAAQPEADALNLLVFRRLEDGVPAALATRSRSGVAGQAREETFGPVLPEGFAPQSLQGELPARLDPDGKLHVQVQLARGR